MSAYYQLIQRQIDKQGVVTAHYQSTHHAQGAWNAHEQHMAPATGVICAELEHFSPRNDVRIGRLSLDILGLIAGGEFYIRTKVIRAGKTIELIESEMVTQGKISIVARTWRMMTSNSQSVAGLEDQSIGTPEQLPIWHEIRQWPGGYRGSGSGSAHAPALSERNRRRRGTSPFLRCGYRTGYWRAAQ